MKLARSVLRIAFTSPRTGPCSDPCVDESPSRRPALRAACGSHLRHPGSGFAKSLKGNQPSGELSALVSKQGQIRDSKANAQQAPRRSARFSPRTEVW